MFKDHLCEENIHNFVSRCSLITGSFTQKMSNLGNLKSGHYKQGIAKQMWSLAQVKLVQIYVQPVTRTEAHSLMFLGGNASKALYSGTKKPSVLSIIMFRRYKHKGVWVFLSGIWISLQTHFDAFAEDYTFEKKCGKK